jgi:hypothetical protein
MIFSRTWDRGSLLIRASLIAVSAMTCSASDAAATPDAIAGVGQICMPAGTYRMAGGGATVFSQEKTCFSRPVTNRYRWEKKAAQAKRSVPDNFSGTRVARYDYQDALYQCAHRRMRLPTVQELGALFAYVNAANGATAGSRYAIVAPANDPRYPGGIYGWGGASAYRSHTFAGNGLHKVVNLGDGRISIFHDSQAGYVSCVR